LPTKTAARLAAYQKTYPINHREKSVAVVKERSPHRKTPRCPAYAGSEWPKLKRLQENHDVGRAFEPAEERAILEMAAKNRSQLIYPFLYTLAWTGMRSDEARTLRWSQVNFEGGEVVVGKSRTEAGKGRRIPMSANLKAVLSTHASVCAAKLGKLHPDWFVFPLSNRLAFKDPTKPVTTMKTAWEAVRAPRRLIVGYTISVTCSGRN
jgi:integrase